jgi:5-methylcytosine-specific restriction endonuclease McrA
MAKATHPAIFTHGTSHGYNYHKCRCEQCKQWVRDYQRAYYRRKGRHRDPAYFAGYYKANKERIVENAMRNAERRRARRRTQPAYRITERDWRRLCHRYDDRCAYCNEGKPLQREHIIPISRGGQHSIGNLLPACKSCNLSKMSSTITEWRRRQLKMSVT